MCLSEKPPTNTLPPSSSSSSSPIPNTTTPSTTSTSKTHAPPQSSSSSSSSTTTPSLSSSSSHHLSTAQSSLQTGVFYSCTLLFFLTFSWGITMPFSQSRRDSLHCDASCYGAITSARSLLGLFGSFFMGYLSDNYGGSSKRGRHFCLYVGGLATILGFVVGVKMNSVRGLWWSMIPGSLFASQSSVCKALVADYHEVLEWVEGCCSCEEMKQQQQQQQKQQKRPPANLSRRSSSMGKMGMTAGLAIMIGPAVGTVLAQDYNDAALLAIIFIIISSLLVTKLPTVDTSIVNDDDDNDDKDKQQQQQQQKQRPVGRAYWHQLRSSHVLSTPGPIFLMILRTLMALAFHIFYIIWSPSLKRRFDFGPKDHGTFMSFIGLSYALSQGAIAKTIINYFPKRRHRTRILMISAVILGTGRYFALRTKDLRLVYALFSLVIIALGVVNTILAADASGTVPSSDMGTLFGTLEAVESGAGIVGPMLGASLSLLGGGADDAPLLVVMMLYALVFVMVFWGYERFVLSAAKGKSVLRSNDEDMKKR